MYVKTLDNERVRWKKTNNTRNKTSQLHQRAREFLKQVFPTAHLMEEVSIPVWRNVVNSTLYLDFYLPMYGLAVEVHGEQHYKFSTKFHKKPNDFMKSRIRDATKAEWCELNDITLVVLPFNKSNHHWANYIIGATDDTDDD